MVTEHALMQERELEKSAKDLVERICEELGRNPLDNGNNPHYNERLQRLEQVASVLAKLSAIPRSESGLTDRSFLSLVPFTTLAMLLDIVKGLQAEIPADINELVAATIRFAFTLRKAIDEARDRARVSAIHEASGNAIDEALGVEVNVEDLILTKLSIDLAGVAAEQVFTDAVLVSRAKTEQQEAAGDVAESELAKEFVAYGTRQELVGYIWLGVAFAFFGATVVVALIVLRDVGQSFDWYSLASHLLLALPCLGLGAYCARESSRHRELAQWARRLAVQLKSVSAYTSRLDDGPRMALLAQFGTYVFGHHQLGKDDNQVQPIPAELWNAVADVIRNRGRAEA